MKKIWIDIDNSPHVPFFNPVSLELARRGYELFLTARNAYQVKELLQVYKMEAQIIGKHYGKNRLLKVLGCLYRALQLAPRIIREKPDVAISHGSRSMLFLAKILKIPIITLFDYEFGQTIPFIKPDLLIVPEVVTSIPFIATNVLKYKGIKEDVYVPFFKPNDDLVTDLNINDTTIIITIRPPATEAHYHNSESALLFDEVIRFLSDQDVIMVILPRNDRQAVSIRKKWRVMCDTRKIIIPPQALDGLGILWNSDLVISGGGTMNREATALGLPVYSIFRGKMGAVDLSLEKEGRLVFIENSDDLRNKIILKKRTKPYHLRPKNSALDQVIGFIILFLEKPAEFSSRKSDNVEFKKLPLLN